MATCKISLLQPLLEEGSTESYEDVAGDVTGSN